MISKLFLNYWFLKIWNVWIILGHFLRLVGLVGLLNLNYTVCTSGAVWNLLKLGSLSAAMTLKRGFLKKSTSS
jgi:hypothetical protein